MKKIKYTILSLALITVVATSCKKWVDYNPKEDFVITEQEYLKSETDYRTMAISVYTPLQWLNQAVVVGEVASDNAVPEVAIVLRHPA